MVMGGCYRDSRDRSPPHINLVLNLPWRCRVALVIQLCSTYRIRLAAPYALSTAEHGTIASKGIVFDKISMMWVVGTNIWVWQWLMPK
jgi:hypothetical protein